MKKIKLFKKKINYRKLYKETLKKLEYEKDNNSKLMSYIDQLEYSLDKDKQANKIKQLELLLEDYRRCKHELRQEIIELKKENK